MPISYRIEAESNCLFAHFSGYITRDELKRFIDAVYEDERLAPQHLRFNDLRAITGPRETRELSEFAVLGARLDAAKPPKKSAILASQDIDFGMARVFIGHMGEAGDAWNVFRELDAAAHWLGLPEPATDPFESGVWTEVT